MQTTQRAGTRRAATELAIPAHLRELSDLLPVMLTFGDAQEVLCTSTRTLRGILSRGEIRCVRSKRSGSSRVLIPRAELLRWLAERST
jgi:excisionase family DNA binding protein